jgi:hypothetical protein
MHQKKKAYTCKLTRAKFCRRFIEHVVRKGASSCWCYALRLLGREHSGVGVTPEARHTAQAHSTEGWAPPT